MTQLARMARCFWKAERVVAAGGGAAEMRAREEPEVEDAWRAADMVPYFRIARRALNSLQDPRDLNSDLAIRFRDNATFRLGWRAAMQMIVDEAHDQGVE